MADGAEKQGGSLDAPQDGEDALLLDVAVEDAARHPAPADGVQRPRSPTTCLTWMTMSWISTFAQRRKYR